MKDKNLLKQLFLINLLYAYPNATNNMKKKGNINKSFTKKVFRQYALGIIFTAIIYGGFMYTIEFGIAPMLFDLFLGCMILMTVMMSLTYQFNLFYEDTNDMGYLALPISPKKVFISKLATIAFMMLPQMISVFVLLVMFFLKTGQNYIYTAVFSIINFIIFMMVAMSINIFIGLLMGKLSGSMRMKKNIVTVMSIVSMFLNIGVFIGLQRYFQEQILLSLLQNKKIYAISTLLSSFVGQLIFISISLVVLILIFKIIMKKGGEELFKDIRRLNKTSVNNKKKEYTKGIKVDKKIGLGRVLLKYNLTAFKDQTILSQNIVTMILPIFMAIMFSVNSKDIYNMYATDNIKLTIFLTMGFVLSIISNSGTNISAIIFSMDGKMFEFIKTLPITRKSYINSKLKIAFVLQSIPYMLGLIVIAFVLKLFSIYMILIGLGLIIFNTALLSLWAVYDYKNVLIEWTNYTQLIGKVGKVLPSIIIIGGFFAFGLLSGMTVAGIVDFYATLFMITMIISVFAIIAVVSLKKLYKV